MRVNVKVSKETHLKLLKIATDRKKSLDEIINEAMTKDIQKTKKIEELELKIEKLKEQQLQETKHEEKEDFFDCRLLCKRFTTCNLEAMNHLSEIKTLNCYQHRFPHCRWLKFASSQPYGDPDKPHGICWNKKPAIRIPEDFIIRDPELCWMCVNIMKAMREEKEARKIIPYHGPKVYFSDKDFTLSQMRGYY